MKITIEGQAKEIATLVLTVQGQKNQQKATLIEILQEELQEELQEVNPSSAHIREW